MMDSKHSYAVSAGAAALSLLLAGVPQQTQASGFQLIEQSVSGMGTAYAGGAAQAQDATTVFFNPAGMTRLKGSHGSVGLHAISPHADYEDQGSVGLGTPLWTNESGDAGEIGLVPNLYLTNQIGDRLFLGLGINAPFGLATSYDDDWIGRYHAIDSEVMTININPALAWKLSEHFSIGAGVNAQYIKAKLSNAIDFALMSGAQVTDGKVELEGDDVAIGWNLGFLAELNEGSRIGVHYRSKVKYKVDGTADFSNVPAVALNPPFGDGVTPATFIFTDTGVTSDVELPATLSVSLYHEFNPEWAIMFDYSRTYWSVLKELRFDFENFLPDGVTTLKWKDSNRYSLGLQYSPSSSPWTFRIGTAYDESPIPSEHYRTPRIPGEDRIWLALGLGYKASENISFDFGYAHLFVDDPRVNKSLADVENIPRGNLNGEYEASVDIVSIQMNWSF
jgi:long-chain fatty acid transport protein